MQTILAFAPALFLMCRSARWPIVSKERQATKTLSSYWFHYSW